VPHLRHSGAANVATLDGSVTAKSIDELFAMDLPEVTGAGAGVTHVIEP
jgi:prepilin-type processing-associated H-X9-DG protein